MDHKNRNVKIAIQDAGVMVDLSRAGIINSAFLLPVTYYTSDSVFDELRPNLQEEFYPFIETTQLRCEPMDAAMFATIAKHQPMHPELSSKDLSVLHIAQVNNLPVLTSCNTLRLCMRRFKLEAKSTYWVVDQLASYSIVTARQAGVLYQKLNKANPRLAPDDYMKGRHKWQDNS